MVGEQTLQAVTRVKLEQASKVVMWTPTRPDNGEGSTDREESRAGTRNSPTNEHPIRSTGVLSTACSEKVVFVISGDPALAEAHLQHHL